MMNTDKSKNKQLLMSLHLLIINTTLSIYLKHLQKELQLAMKDLFPKVPLNQSSGKPMETQGIDLHLKKISLLIHLKWRDIQK